MNTRDNKKIVYEYLLTKGEYITQYDLGYELYVKGYTADFYSANTSAADYHNSLYRHRLTAVIRDINYSPDYEKLIICDGKGVKIATEEEYDTAIKGLYGAVFAKLQRIRFIEKKAKRNGQMTIEGKEILAFLEKEQGAVNNETF